MEHPEQNDSNLEKYEGLINTLANAIVNQELNVIRRAIINPPVSDLELLNLIMVEVQNKANTLSEQEWEFVVTSAKDGSYITIFKGDIKECETIFELLLKFKKGEKPAIDERQEFILKGLLNILDFKNLQ